jgi:hypothetical protein
MEYVEEPMNDNEKLLRLQAALNELATQNNMLRDRCAAFAADLAIMHNKVEAQEKQEQPT